VTGSQKDSGPYCPEDPDPPMIEQLPPCCPNKEQPVSSKEPITADSPGLLVSLNTQVNDFWETHWHVASFGVGGSDVEARKLELGCKQAGNCVCPASDWLGLLMNDTLAYWALSRLKSSDVVTLLLSEESVIIPKLP